MSQVTLLTRRDDSIDQKPQLLSAQVEHGLNKVFFTVCSASAAEARCALKLPAAATASVSLGHRADKTPSFLAHAGHVPP